MHSSFYYSQFEEALIKQLHGPHVIITVLPVSTVLEYFWLLNATEEEKRYKKIMVTTYKKAVMAGK